METIFYLYIFIIWTLFWSFSSVIIDRLKNHKKWIITWRSECPKCRHKLWFKDLIPIFSFLSTKWKCRYCRRKISYFYPILEVIMWIIFVITTYFLVDIDLILNWNLVEIYKLLFFLLFSFFTLVYTIYDVLYLEIPDSILAILIVISFFTISLQSTIPWFQIINTLPSFNIDFSFKEIITVISLWILIISGFYFIMLKWLKEIYDLAILSIIIWAVFLTKFYFNIDLEETPIWNAIIWSLAIFIFLFLQILLSKWAWMWGGDLRIWILVWLIVWIFFSIHSLIISYMLWSLVWIWIIIYRKIKLHRENKKLNIIKKIKKLVWLEEEITLNTKMPFWPFLAIWIYAILFWWNYINDLLKDYL